MKKIVPKEIKIEAANEVDYWWAKAHICNVLFKETAVGEIIYWTFNKESILENIEEDYAFYMDEDTHMHENTANFILNTIDDRNCVYIESIFINEKYRNKGIGKKVIELMKEKYKESYIVLFASALDIKDKIAFINEKNEHMNNLLSKLDYFYKKLGFKNKDNIYYIN